MRFFCFHAIAFLCYALNIRLLLVIYITSTQRNIKNISKFKVEKTILNKDINIDVLKVAHHGSKYSSCKEFLTIATPEYAIISAGEGNSYGHPEEETITRLKQHTNKIYVTKDLGTIVLTSDGTSIIINNYSTNTNG